MPVRFAEKQRAPKGAGQWLKPLAAFEAVVVGLVMSLLLIKENPIRRGSGSAPSNWSFWREGSQPPH